MSEIRCFEACRARLGALLAEADTVRASGDGNLADKLADALAAFANDSRPDDPGDAAEVAAIAKLDALAGKVQDEMTAIALGRAVDMVVDHAAELEAIGRTLGRQTLANADAGRRIRLTPIRDLIDRMTDAVAAVKVAAKSLDAKNPDEAAIQREIATLASSFQALVGAAHDAIGRAAR